MLLTGRLFTAEYFKNIGVLSDIIDVDKIDDYVMAYAEKIADETSPNSIAVTRAMIAEIQTYRPFDAMNYAAELNARVRMHDDCKRGIAAFLDKGEVKW